MTHFALLIGNSKYASTLPDLNSPELDINLMQAALTSPPTGIFDAGNVRILANRTRREIEAEIATLWSSSGRGDTILLYYSGHGLNDRTGRHLYLAASDSRPDGQHATGVAASFINEITADVAARRMLPKVVLILDCCFAGEFNSYFEVDDQRYILAAASSGSAPDSAVGDPSQFTAAVARVLLGSSPTKNKRGVSVQHLIATLELEEKNSDPTRYVRAGNVGPTFLARQPPEVWQERRFDDALAAARLATAKSVLERYDELPEPVREALRDLLVFGAGTSVPTGLLAQWWEWAGRWTAGRTIDLVEELQFGRILQSADLVDTAPSTGSAERGTQLTPAVYARLAESTEDLRGRQRSFVSFSRTRLPDSRNDAWWELSKSDNYLADRIMTHLRHGGLDAEADTLSLDLRWIAASIHRLGSTTTSESELHVVDTSIAFQVRAWLGRHAHVFVGAPTLKATHATMLSRLTFDARLDGMASTWNAVAPTPRLTARWPLPDEPDPAQQRLIQADVGRIHNVVVDPSDDSLIVAGDGGSSRWSLSGEPRAIAPDLPAHGAVTCCALSADGSVLVAGRRDGLVIFDRGGSDGRGEDSSRAVVLPGPSVHRCAVSGPGDVVVTVAVDGRPRLTTFGQQPARSTIGWTSRGEMLGHRGKVNCCAISDTHIATGSDDGTVLLWDLGGRRRRLLTGDRTPVYDCTFGADGSLIAAATEGGRILVWQVVGGVPSGAPKERYSLSSRANCCVFGPDDAWLAGGTDDGSVHRLSRLERDARLLRGHHRSVEMCAAGPDGSWLASVSIDGTIRIWDLAAGTGAPEATSRPVRFCTAATDGGWFVTGGPGTTPQWWAVGDTPRLLTQFDVPATIAAVAPSSAAVATGNMRGEISLWSARAVHHMTVRSTGRPVTTLAFAPDGSWLAAGHVGGTVVVMPLNESGAVLRILRKSGSQIRSLVAVSSTELVFGDDTGCIGKLDVLGTTGVDEIDRSSSGIECLAYSPVRNAVFIGDERGTLRAIALGPGGGRGPGDDREIRAHDGPLTGCGINASETLLATTGVDGLVRIWDLLEPWSSRRPSSAEIKVDSALADCEWLDDETLVVAGEGGTYLFTYELHA